MLIKKKPSRARYNERRVGDRVISGRSVRGQRVGKAQGRRNEDVCRKVVREGVTKLSEPTTDKVNETKIINESAQAPLIPRGIRKRYIG